MVKTPSLVFGATLALSLGAGSSLGLAAPLAGGELSGRTVEQGSDQDPGTLRKAVRRASQHGAIADADRDGRVTREEASAFFAARFARMDVDRDGALSEEEFLSHGAGAPATGWPVAFRTGPRTGFEAIDLDGDGVLSREEFLRASIEQREAERPDRLPRRRAIFAALDADGDGSVSRKEYLAAAARHFARSDKDGVGALTLWEFFARLRF